MTLDEAFNYDPLTGIIKWRSKRRGIKQGMIAGKRDINGYVVITFDGKTYRAANLAWRLYYGEWPDKKLDHKNRINNDNRINNLRPATRSQNNANTKRKHRSMKGVYRYKKTKWIAKLTANGVYYHLGIFDCPLLAYIVVQNKHQELWGEFSCV